MRRKTRPGGGRQVEVMVESLGGRGDGVAELDGRPVFVPLTLPGDRVRVRLTGPRAGGTKAEVIERLDDGPGHVAAPCPHFGPCGGCAVQHLAPERYVDWKRDQVVQAMARRGLDPAAAEPLVRITPGSRRRATLAAARQGGRLRLGFHMRHSRQVVDLSACLLLAPALVALLPRLREALAQVLRDGEAAAVALTATETGIDVLVGCDRGATLADRETLAALAERADLAQVSWGLSGAEPEPVVRHRAPRVTFAGIAVEPPPGGFLQPTVEGEAGLVARVLEGLPDPAARILELFAGCGTFTFPLAGTGRVRAVEGDQAALAALRAAADRAGLAGRVETEARDLARRPLEPAELARFDCVVFDPPRAGAREQAARIAASALPAAVAVSCNPHTFARDARVLVDGGFELLKVTPIDQFPWSGHLELVALFRR